MGRPAHNLEVCEPDQLRRSFPYGDTLDVGVWICLANAVADCLGDLPDAGHLEEHINLRLVIATQVGREPLAGANIS